MKSLEDKYIEHIKELRESGDSKKWPIKWPVLLKDMADMAERHYKPSFVDGMAEVYLLYPKKVDGDKSQDVRFNLNFFRSFEWRVSSLRRTAGMFANLLPDTLYSLADPLFFILAPLTMTSAVAPLSSST